MTMPVFAVQAEALSAADPGDQIALDGDEGRHAALVRRIRVGERIMLTDGQGNGAECDVESVARQSLVAKVWVRRTQPPPQPRLVVVQAIPKGDHAERAVDLLTEVGADVIVPWAASRAVVTWKGDRATKALRRWRATAQAAAKQSRRLWFPEVTDLHSTAEVAGLVSHADAAFVLHEAGPAESPTPGLPAQGDIVLVVGPEGGVTDDEITALVDRGATPLRLGPTVLRSSTAGVVGAAVVLSRTSRWSESP